MRNTLFYVIVSGCFAAVLIGQVDYTTQIQPVFNSSCNSGSCHGGSAGGLDLTSYDNLMKGDSNNGPVVMSGDGANSVLVQKLGSMPPFGDRMPKNLDPLPDATINLISQWIDEGANEESISVEEWMVAVPAKFRIVGNYPNPFNPKTTIVVELARKAHIELVVSDILGRDVAVLMRAPLDRGSHRIVWDAADHPSGAYFARLITNGESEKDVTDGRFITMTLLK